MLFILYALRELTLPLLTYTELLKYRRKLSERGPTIRHCER